MLSPAKLRIGLAAVPLSVLAVALLAAPVRVVGAAADDKKPAPASMIAAYCVVTDEEIADKASAKSVVRDGKTYYLCCPGCEPAFAKNPAKFSKLADLRSDVRATQPKLDAAKEKAASAEKATPAATESELAALRAEVTTLEKKLADLKANIGKVERGEAVSEAPAKPGEVFCAVQNSVIPSADKAVTVSFNTKTYYLCCAGCKAKFESDPAKFAKEADEKAAKRAAAAAKS